MMADEKGSRGMLLRQFLNAEVHDHSWGNYDVLERVETFFKKSEDEKQERRADFSEWIQDIVQQPHSEIDFEDDGTESAPVTERPSKIGQDVITELTA
jgi:hypothetical protein